MNKQQKTYGLLIAVLIIWGIIGYQIYMRMNPSTLELSVTKPNNNFVAQPIIETSFYEVKGSYRDPFLGKYPQKKKIRKKKIIKKPIEKPKPTVPFPNVVYNGIIEGNGAKLYILTINGRQEIVKLGQEFKKILLVSADSKQATVKFQEVEKTILVKQ